MTPESHGWIKLHRKLLAWPLFKKPLTAHLWQYCLLRANHEPADIWASGETVHLEPGQFIIGRHAATKETGLSEKQYRTAINHLENENCIKRANHSANQFSIITIVNWPTYQSNGTDTGQPKGQAGANQGPTKGQPRATDKNDKKEEEGEEEEETSSAKADNACPGFDRFWKAWPKHFRKTGKTKCQAIWKRQGLEARTEQVLLAVKQDKGSPKWEEDGGQYVPMPSTWLNGCRWDRDETCTDEPEHEAPRDPSVPEGWVRGSDGELHMDLENFVCPDPEYANEVMEQIRANTKTPEEEAYLEDADRRARKIEEADRLARKSANV